MVLKATWAGIIGAEGRPTGDGRYIEDGALRWVVPMPFRSALVDNGGHDGAVVIGNLETITRAEDGMIHATGTFDMGSENGQEAYRQVSEGLTTGVSFDLDDFTAELRLSSEVADQIEAEQGDGEDGEPPAGLQRNEDGSVTIMKTSPSDEVEWITDARIRSATLVAIPAFIESTVTAESVEAGEQDEDEEPVEAIAASGVARPSAKWFTNPKLTEPTALIVEDTGRVYGHIALWGTCHIGLPACTTPPASASSYSGFLLGAVRCADGSDVAVGHITIDTGHAGPKLSASEAIRHYDDTGTQVADIASGEDAYGIWVAGRVSPRATPEQIDALRSAPPSGDWRRIGTDLELIAVLGVNVPGFPVPRPTARVKSGNVVSMVAAGMLVQPRMHTGGLSDLDLALLRSAADRERRIQAAALARTVLTLEAPLIRARASRLAARRLTGVK